jgi:small-conductance mechanosensitive channel
MKYCKELIVNRIFREINILAVFLYLFLLIPETAVAQETVDADPELPGIQQPVAPVKVDGEILFKVRGISSYPAETRAAAISKRIMEAAADQTVQPDSVKSVFSDDHYDIYAGMRFIMTVYKEDADIEQISGDILADVIRKKTVEALQIYRNNRSRPMLIKKAVHALVALIALTLILLLITWLFRRINTGLQKRIKARIDSVENISFSLIRANQIWKTYHLAVKIVRIVIIVLFVAAGINYILGLFPWTNNVATYILNLVLNPFRSLGKGLLLFLPDLAFLIVIYLVTRYLLKLSRLLFTGIHQGGITIKNFDPDWAMPTFRIVRILVIVFAVVIAYPYIPGSESNAFKGISVFIGVLFSLGSSSFISNLIAGYSMTYRRAFKKGDRILVGDQVGFVDEQELLVTRLRSVKNEEVIIPNSILLNSNITNFSAKARELGLILHTTVGIGYETPWRLVDAMLKEAAGRTEGLLKEPPPFVLKLSLGDFAVTYEINAYCNDVSRMHLCYTALHQHILDVFNENNVQIMTPAYEGDPEIPKVVPKEQWDLPLKRDKGQGTRGK